MIKRLLVTLTLSFLVLFSCLCTLPASKESFTDQEDFKIAEQGVIAIGSGSAELIIGVSGMSSEDRICLMNLATIYGGEIINSVYFGGVIEAVVLNLPSSSILAFADEANKLFRPAYIELNTKFKMCLVPNDPYWHLQWGSAKIEADYAWNKTIGNSSILVAIIDTGVDYDHPDLAANYVPLGYDWVNKDDDPMDDNGHGTHVAGIVAAVINNSIGVAGIAQVRIMAEKGLDQSGYGDADDLANAIVHAADQGAHIITMSWGSNSSSVLIMRAVKYAYRSGALLVAAAGNEATSQKTYPAAYDEVIAVSATDKFDNPASFTNYGDWIELAAPGVSIYSTVLDDGYNYKSGTSMATPHVAGAAALIWSVFPELTREQVRIRLQETADDLGAEGFDIYYGYGRVNARKAVAAHDIAITGVSPRKNIIAHGFNVEIDVNITNKGDVTESFNVTLYVNETLIQTTRLTLANGDFAMITFTWNTSGFAIGNYTISAYVPPVPSETSIADNLYVDGIVQIVPPTHDIAISNITFSKQYPMINETIQIYVTIENRGTFTETFNVSVNSLCILDFLIGTQVITLTFSETITVNFTWTPVAAGRYEIRAYTSEIPEDINPTDNTLTAYISVISSNSGGSGGSVSRGFTAKKL